LAGSGDPVWSGAASPAAIVALPDAPASANAAPVVATALARWAAGNSSYDVPPEKRREFWDRLYDESGFGIWVANFPEIFIDDAAVSA
jgi:hypothetical protein